VKYANTCLLQKSKAWKQMAPKLIKSGPRIRCIRWINLDDEESGSLPVTCLANLERTQWLNGKYKRSKQNRKVSSLRDESIDRYYICQPRLRWRSRPCFSKRHAFSNQPVFLLKLRDQLTIPNNCWCLILYNQIIVLANSPEINGWSRRCRKSSKLFTCLPFPPPLYYSTLSYAS
jgi:hypothetical protein